MEKKTLAIFDFDGTITRGDSFFHFLRFMKGDIRFALGLLVLSPWIAGYKAGIIPNYKAKERVTRWFFGGMNLESFNRRALEFSNLLDRWVKESAREKIAYHKREGHEVVVISASFENYLKPWCEKNSIKCLATRLETKEGRLTGNFSGKNCHGKEKVNRLNEHYEVSGYTEVHVYGDSSGDRELLEIAHVKNYRNLH